MSGFDLSFYGKVVLDYYGNTIGKLIEAFRKLPGIGEKSATRLAFYIIAMPREEVQSMAEALVEARNNVKFCKMCQTITDGDYCPICTAAMEKKRDIKKIMVVENSRDLMAYERTGHYDGVYHVLHGAISPMQGIGPNDIRLKELLKRLTDGEGKPAADEVIIATNSSVEGESTAMYIVKLIRTLGLKIKLTRIASGVPVGGDIENIDEVTLDRALKGRIEL